MSGKSNKTLADRDLWDLYRIGVDRRGGAGEIDPGLIAAYLDGGLLPAEREAVEAWLASTPEAVDVLLAARRARVEGVRMAAPDALIDAAKRMPHGPVSTPMATAIRRRGFSWLIGAMEWSGAAAALLLACVVGFQLGVDSAEPAATVEVATNGDPALELVTPIESLFDNDRLDPFANGDPS